MSKEIFYDIHIPLVSMFVTLSSDDLNLCAQAYILMAAGRTHTYAQGGYCTALMSAAKKGRTDYAHLLLGEGADTNANDKVNHAVRSHIRA